MKKLVLSMALLAGMTFVACSDDDNKKNGNCVTCEAYEMQGNTVPAIEVCKNSEGNAEVGGQDSGIEFDDYIDIAEMVTECN